MKWDHINAFVRMVINHIEIKIVKVCAAIATCIIVLNYHSLESVNSIGRDTHIIVIMQF